MLKELQNFVNESNETNSNSDKLAVIKKYANNPEVTRLLNYTYDSFKKYNITSANCKKRNDLVSSTSSYNSLISLLDDLNNRVITGHDAIKAVNRFVQDNAEFEDVIWMVIDRNLKTRSTVTMINKVMPGLIPTFDVALACAYDENSAKKVNWQDGWYVSRKLDGVRCIAVVKANGDVNFYSRAGNEFETLGVIADELKRVPQDIILDGEICMIDGDGNEDFQGIIKEIKRKNHTIRRPKFMVFDMLTHAEFGSQTSTRTFKERQESLQSWFENYAGEFDFIQPLQQTLVTNDEQLQDYIKLANVNKWEGLMLRKNVEYKGKRSDDILKVKQFHDAEYVVVGTENAINRVIVDGKEVEEEMMRNVIIEHKGNRVQVGSGFSQEEKRHYYANPDQIIGKTICVQYFEESKNQHGQYSLRFPVVKAIYEGVRNF